MASAKHWIACTLGLLLGTAGCTVIRKAPQPIYAEIKIEVINPDGSTQWRTARRIEWTYQPELETETQTAAPEQEK